MRPSIKNMKIPYFRLQRRREGISIIVQRNCLKIGLTRKLRITTPQITKLIRINIALIFRMLIITSIQMMLMTWRNMPLPSPQKAIEASLVAWSSLWHHNWISFQIENLGASQTHYSLGCSTIRERILNCLSSASLWALTSNNMILNRLIRLTKVKRRETRVRAHFLPKKTSLKSQAGTHQASILNCRPLPRLQFTLPPQAPLLPLPFLSPSKM